MLSAPADNVGFSQINCLYLRAQIIWAFPTSFSCSDTDKKTEGAQMRLEKPILFARADKGSLFERNPHYLRAQIKAVYLRETHIICARR